MESNKWGDGKYCENGLKFYCCEVDQAKSIDCYWNDGLSCKNDDVDMTYDYEGFVFGRVFCCSPTEAKRWNNCEWRGKEGNCFDNHCDTISQVQLAESKSGEGKTCGIHLERQRVYCCDPAEGETLFLPVPLDYLFPDAPDEDTADAEYKLKVDPTWGGEVTASDDEPNDAAFGFFVLASPEEIQTSLDKRDGSHWELFDCFDDVTEGTHTIRMICSDTSEDSNCNKIYLGKGVPGTIIEMPSKCGPGKYAVANNMQVSSNQTLPDHLNKRAFPEDAVVHDLTFNYDFTLVPRDFGDTQMRLDFSNEKGYWDAVVNKAGNSKRKRSLDDHQGNHKRWLEEEWRDDFHKGARETSDLHKRWFGSDVVDWLKGLLNVATGGGLEVQHSVDETLTVILINEQYGPCNFKGVDVQANIKAEARANVKVSTSFGLTIVSTLTIPPDLSSSHLYFKNNGEVSATFTVDALTSATFKTDDIELYGLDQFPGATFTVPGILTVGPNFRLFGAVDASVEIAGHLQADVAIGSWDIQQTYPAASKEYEPQGLSTPSIDGTQADLDDMTFDYSVTANGSLSIHLKPTFTFGIEFNPSWKVDDCKVDLVADGYIKFSASATTQSGSCPFTYGIEAGAELYAQVAAPEIYGWNLNTDHYSIQRTEPIPIVQGDSCPKSENHKRNVLPYGADYFATGTGAHVDVSASTHSLNKRSDVIGPLLRLKKGLSCPGEDSNNGTYGCPLCGDDDSLDSSDLTRRDDDATCAYEPVAPGLEACAGDFGGLSQRWLTGAVALDKRANSQKTLAWEYPAFTRNTISIGYYPSCSAGNLPSGVGKWYDYKDINNNGGCSAEVVKKNKDTGKNSVDGRPIREFATEHIFEAQLLTRFLNFLYQEGNKGPERYGYKQAGWDWVSVVLIGLQLDPGYTTAAGMTAHHDSNGKTVLEAMGAFIDNEKALVLTSSAINTPKLSWFGGNTPNAGDDPSDNGLETLRRVRNVSLHFPTVTPGL
jgi:chitinase